MSVFNTSWQLKLNDNIGTQMAKVRDSFAKGYASYRNLQEQLDKNQQKAKQYTSSIDDLNKKLDNLTKTRNISVNVSDIRNLNKEIDLTLRQIDKIKGRGSSGHWGQLKQAATEMPGMGPMVGMATNPYVLGGVAAYKTLSFGVDAAMTRFDYNRQFAKINATAQLDKNGLAGLRNEVMAEGRTATVPLSQVPAAFEQILSATNNLPLSKQILKYSLKGAQAGFADVGEVASATTGILNAVGSKKTNAAQVMDVLFASKRLGVGEFADFSRYLPANITQGTGLGYDYRDVAGAFSYFTTKGNKADATSTLMSNMFTALGKTEVTDKLAKHGIETYKDGQRRDLYSVLNDLAKKLDGKNQVGRDKIMADIFTDAQARQAVNTLTNDTDLLGKMMLQTRESTGELKKALDSTADEMNVLQQASNNWQYFKDNVGTLFAPIINKTLTYANQQVDTYLQQKEVAQLPLDKQKDYWARTVLSDMRRGNVLPPNLTDLGAVMSEQGLGKDNITGYFSSLKKYSKITNDEIKRDPTKWGLKFYGRLGTMQDFGIKPPETFGGGGGKNTTTTDTTNDTFSNLQDNISGGGNIKNFTVTIGQLKTADNLHLHNATTADNAAEVEDIIFEKLIRAVRSVEQSAGGAN